MIRVLFFAPGQEHDFRQLASNIKAWHDFIGAEELNCLHFTHRERRYTLWFDDYAESREVSANREIKGGRHDGLPICGPFFITQRNGEEYASIDETDLDYIWTFLTRKPS